jgi:hypothetical protein
VSKGNKGTSAQGQGVVATKDGSERANYTAVWSTDSIGKLAILDNMLSFFKVELDERGNFSSNDRELKNNVPTSRCAVRCACYQSLGYLLPKHRVALPSTYTTVTCRTMNLEYFERYFEYFER